MSARAKKAAVPATAEKAENLLPAVEADGLKAAFKDKDSAALIVAYVAERAVAPAIVTTEAERAEVASVAYRVSRSKTALESVADDLVEPLKAETKRIGELKKFFGAELDALRDKILIPARAFEKREEDRKAAILARMNDLTPRVGERASLADLRAERDRIDAFEVGEDFAEFRKQAASRRSEGLVRLDGWIMSAEERDEREARERALKEQVAALQAQLAAAQAPAAPPAPPVEPRLDTPAPAFEDPFAQIATPPTFRAAPQPDPFLPAAVPSRFAGAGAAAVVAPDPAPPTPPAPAAQAMLAEAIRQTIKMALVDLTESIDVADRVARAIVEGRIPHVEVRP